MAAISFSHELWFPDRPAVEVALSFSLKAFRNLVAGGMAFLKAKDGAGDEA